jgi:CheY-like chemotaxis protein
VEYRDYALLSGQQSSSTAVYRIISTGDYYLHHCDTPEERVESLSKTIIVLLIEDNPADARLVQEMFKEEQMRECKLDHASSLSAGLRLLDQGRYDALLLDLHLHDSDGMDTLLAVRSAKPKMPIVVLTGLSDEDAALAAIHRGAQDYLVKGKTDIGLLARVIRFAIERKQILEEKAELVGQLQEALANIKTLRGMVPICSSCKKIRDDKGFWEQLEAYITQHSEAVFSHGYCPECAAQMKKEWHKKPNGF